MENSSLLALSTCNRKSDSTASNNNHFNLATDDLAYSKWKIHVYVMEVLETI